MFKLFSKAHGFLLFSFLGFFSCDLATPAILDASKEVEKAATSTKSTATDFDASALLKGYFEALSVRDHKQLQKLLFYSNKFYLKEPQPIIKWELLSVEELTEKEANAYLIKPNPIKEDLLLKVKISTIDEYKKRTWKQQYFVREHKGKWGFVNRIGTDTCLGIYLKYGEEALDFEEYKVLAQRKGQYLVQIAENKAIVVNEKTRELGKIVANRDCSISFLSPNHLYCGDRMIANWLPSGALELIAEIENNETSDSTKIE